MKKLFISILLLSSLSAFSMEFKKRHVSKQPKVLIISKKSSEIRGTRTKKTSLHGFCEVVKFVAVVGAVTAFSMLHNMQQHSMHQ